MGRWEEVRYLETRFGDELGGAGFGPASQRAPEDLEADRLAGYYTRDYNPARLAARGEAW